MLSLQVQQQFVIGQEKAITNLLHLIIEYEGSLELKKNVKPDKIDNSSVGSKSSFC